MTMIHRSQDERVEALADRILADERATAALMEHFEEQMRHGEGPLRRFLRAIGHACVQTLAAVAALGESTAGIPGDDRDRAAGGPPPHYLDGWPWPW